MPQPERHDWQPCVCADEALRFLHRYAAGWPGNVSVMALAPDGAVRFKTVAVDQIDELEPFIESRNGTCNLYFGVNPLATNHDKKTAKSGIAALAYVHVDLDPRDGFDLGAERERLKKLIDEFPVKPNLIIDSGGGFQVFWRLREPVLANGNIERLEGYNRRLAARLGGDHCWNIDRLMRLPGTVNLPDAQKRARGRQPAFAQLVYSDEGAYALEDFEALLAGAEGAQAQTDQPKISVDDLRISDAFKQLIRHGLPKGSRSEGLFGVTRAMVQAGYTDEEIAEVLMDPSNALSEKPHEKGPAWLRGEIKRAREKPDKNKGAQRHETGTELDVFLLPNDNYPFPASATRIFGEIASTHTMFMRGSAVVELIDTPLGRELTVLTPTAFRSRLDRYGFPVYAHVRTRSGIALRQKRCSEDTAKALLATREAQELLPRIDLVANSPIIVERGGAAAILGPGYDAEYRVFVVVGAAAPGVPLPEAVAALRQLLGDYDFQSRGDLSRALAAIVTPALKIGGVLRGATPVDVGEADHSQAGKTLRHKLVRAIYREQAYAVACREGGVGSLDESIGQALLSGRPFVVLDNVRGLIGSQYLESIITTPECVSARVPHRGEVSVDASRVTFQLSSNGVETTRDFANRSSIVRIRKQPQGYRFRQYPEGDLLRHVEANHAYYLGCVFAVVREWIRRGKPRTDECRHDFREWGQSLDWIVQNLFGAAPLLDGHVQAQERVSNPALSWLRQICIAAHQAGRCEQELSATDIFELCAEEGIEFPRRAASAMRREEGNKLVGQLMTKAFQSAENGILNLDHYRISRLTKTEHDDKQRKDREVKRYVIENMRSAPCAP